MADVDKQGLIETVILTLGVLGLFFFFNPQDPLLINVPFPFIWMVPVLLALRHGRVAGAISAILLLLAMFLTIHLSLFVWDAYRAWLLGGLTLTWICAEFHAMWVRRQFSLIEKESYLGIRLEALSRAYGVLRYSHDRLEENLIVKPATLREAYLQLRQLLQKNGGQFNSTIANEYMEVVAYYANLEKAGLYELQNNEWNTQPLASVGEPEELIVTDNLVKRCLDRKQTTYVSVNILEENEVSAYLGVVPMQTADGKILGILTIKDLPFLVLNDETLKTLTLMLAYIADEIYSTQQAALLQKTYPDCPSMFASELFKLKHLYDISGIDSAIVVYHLKVSPKRDEVVNILHQQKRGLDLSWQTTIGSNLILFILMPLTAKGMLQGYVGRIQSLLTPLKLKLNEGFIQYQHRQLSSYKDLTSLLKELHANDNT